MQAEGCKAFYHTKLPAGERGLFFLICLCFVLTEGGKALSRTKLPAGGGELLLL